MTKRERRVFSEEFRHGAVRLFETIGRAIDQIVEDLGAGLSKLAHGKRSRTQMHFSRAVNLFQQVGPHQSFETADCFLPSGAVLRVIYRRQQFHPAQL
jgi:hypothetical protein